MHTLPETIARCTRGSCWAPQVVEQGSRGHMHDGFSSQCSSHLGVYYKRSARQCSGFQILGEAFHLHFIGLEPSLGPLDHLVVGGLQLLRQDQSAPSSPAPALTSMQSNNISSEAIQNNCMKQLEPSTPGYIGCVYRYIVLFDIPICEALLSILYTQGISVTHTSVRAGELSGIDSTGAT